MDSQSTHVSMVAINLTLHRYMRGLEIYSSLQFIISVNMLEICRELEFGSVDSGDESATRYLKIPFILK